MTSHGKISHLQLTWVFLLASVPLKQSIHSHVALTIFSSRLVFFLLQQVSLAELFQSPRITVLKISILFQGCFKFGFANFDRFLLVALPRIKPTTIRIQTESKYVHVVCAGMDSELFHFFSAASIQGTPLLYRLGECMLTCVRSSSRPLLHITNLWRYASPHFTRVC